MTKPRYEIGQRVFKANYSYNRPNNITIERVFENIVEDIILRIKTYENASPLYFMASGDRLREDNIYPTKQAAEKGL